MALDGRVYKRCRHDRKSIETGKPATSRRVAIPACRCDGGSWWWRIDAGKSPVTDQRVQPARGGYSTRAEALEGLREYLEQIRRGGRVDDQGKTVAVWLREWLETGTWKPTTRRSYGDDVNRWLIPLLGRIRLRDLCRGDVRELLTTVAKRDTTRARPAGRGRPPAAQLSGASVDRVRRTLRAALAAAVEEELIRENYARGKFRAIPPRSNLEEAHWQDHQLRAFLTYIADDRLASLWWWFSLTGSRRGEACGLRWEDVDLVSDTPGAIIHQTVIAIPGEHDCPVCKATHRGRVIQQTTATQQGAKTKASTGRWVALSSDVVQELAAHRASQEARRGQLGVLYCDHGLVWAEDDGAPLRPDWVTHRLADLIAEAGLPKVKLHGMRHTAASLLSTTDLTTAQVGELLGHGSEQMTLHYTHAMKSTLSAGVEAIAAMVRPSPEIPRG